MDLVRCVPPVGCTCVQPYLPALPCMAGSVAYHKKNAWQPACCVFLVQGLPASAGRGDSATSLLALEATAAAGKGPRTQDLLLDK